MGGVLESLSRKTASPLSDVFHFSAGPLSSELTFSPQARFPPPLLKRARPVTDVDGENSSGFHKKKRRLRLVLITSRLSPVFSQPATYIVDRGSSKIAVWAKQKALGRNLLRKAAILNCKRLRDIAMKQACEQVPQMLPQSQMEMVRQTFLYGSHDTFTHPVVCTRTAPFPAPPSNLPSFTTVRGPYTNTLPFSRENKADESPSLQFRRNQQAHPPSQIPRRDYIPLPPSPLGLSNYDAFDLEDDPHDDGEDGIDIFGRGGTPSPPSIYTDWNVLDPNESVVSDYDNIEAFAGGTASLMHAINETERRAELRRQQEAERAAEIKAEKERQRNFLFATFN
jgi:hypothetical protein